MRTIAAVLDPKVFKAYDVRGLYPAELDETGAEAIGRAYVEQFEPRRIAVGRDMRLSSPAMQEALMRGAAGAGTDVLDLGLVGTEMVYFAVGSLGLEGGAMVTASHNPKEYTGMKHRALSFEATSRCQAPGRGSGGRVQQYDVWPAYVERVLSFVDVAAIKPLRVVIDAANGMAGAMLSPVLERLPLETIRCYFEPDGAFPNHEPNPLLPENREFIVRKTLDHYYFRDFSQADSGVVPFLLMLELISKKGRLSEILAPLRSRYFITGELNTPVPDVSLKLQELKERYGSDGRVSHLDGISIDFPDWHFNVRPSNTEPLLRLNLEATSEELMEQKRDEVLALIRS